MAKQHPKLERAEYAKRLKDGQLFKDASLYEPQNAPKGTEFFHVNLGKPEKPETVFKRRIK